MALILIVDDSPTEVHVMQKALEKHGYRTAAAADGAEGVRLAREMAIVLVEQYLDFAQELGDQLVVMDRGAIIYSCDRASMDEAALKRALAI